MRTQEEILARMKEVEKEDFFGHQRNDLLNYLSFENAKPYLEEATTPEDWQANVPAPKERMIEYMEFAWEKANDKRGLSASRSMGHYKTWLWLDGNDELSEKMSNYEYYGKPQLVEVCKYLGLEPALYDDGVRENS